MSRFQTNTLMGSIIIAGLWRYFSAGLLDIGVYNGILGAVAILLIGVRIGRRQKRVGFVATILCVLVAIEFLFSIVPVYTKKPTLDVFQASQVPYITCYTNSFPPRDLTINSQELPSSRICMPNNFPIYVGQIISWKSTGGVAVSLTDGSSIYIQGPGMGQLIRTSQGGYDFTFNAATGGRYNPTQDSNAANPIQYDIAHNYNQKKVDYLKENFSRVRQNAPLLTQLSLLKMRIISIFDWSYKEHIKNLTFYMNEISKK